jgi:hypothetical protein
MRKIVEGDILARNRTPRWIAIKTLDGLKWADFESPRRPIHYVTEGHNYNDGFWTVVPGKPYLWKKFYKQIK